MKKWWFCVTVGHEIFSVQRCSDFWYRNQMDTLSASGKISVNVLNRRVWERKCKKNLNLLLLLGTVYKLTYILFHKLVGGVATISTDS